MKELNEFIFKKDLLRREFIQRRDSIQKRQAKQAAMLFNLFSIKILKPMVYVSMGSEADTSQFVKIMFKRTKIFVPFTQNNIINPRLLKSETYLKPQAYGNLDESFLGDAGRPLCSITPLVAFDLNFNRLGYGAGCYDKFFEANPDILKIGIAFDEQQTEQIPSQSHDVKMDYIITPTRILKKDA